VSGNDASQHARARTLTCRAHNPKVAGSNPAPATKKFQLRGPFRSARRASSLAACQRIVNTLVNERHCASTRDGVGVGRRSVDIVGPGWSHRSPSMGWHHRPVAAIVGRSDVVHRSAKRFRRSVDGIVIVRRPVMIRPSARRVANAFATESREHDSKPATSTCVSPRSMTT
jgi:hypothetical protein